MEKEAVQRLTERMQRLCSKSEHCSKDIYTKLFRAAEGDAALASEILEDLKKDRFVDDARYAAAFAREKSSLTGWGPLKIRQALALKGIKGEAAAAALSEIDPERSSGRLRKLLESKWKSLQGDPSARLKLIRYALSRGYEYDEVKSVTEEIFADGWAE